MNSNENGLGVMKKNKTGVDSGIAVQDWKWYDTVNNDGHINSDHLETVGIHNIALLSLVWYASLLSYY